MGLIEGGELHRNQDLDHTIKPCHWSRPFTWSRSRVVNSKIPYTLTPFWTFCMIPIIHSVQYIFAIFGRGELDRNQDLDHTIKPCHWARPFTWSRSRVGNSKIPYTLTLSLPFPVVRNQDLGHTIKPRHWTRPFTPHFRPSDRGKFLVETVIFAW